MPGSGDEAGGRRDLGLRALLERIAREGGRLLDDSEGLKPAVQTRLAELRAAAREALRWIDASARPPEPLPGSAANAPRLLVVDDTEEIRKLLELRLGTRGFEVTSAEDGIAALRCVAEEPFDAVLLDLMMPGISGLDVLRSVRERFSPSALPVIMATARSSAREVIEALELGANDYVTKPFDFPVVMARLEAQLALKREREETRRLAQDLEVRNRFIQATFGRYLSDEVVGAILSSPEGLLLGGEQRKVTILMSDLRGFTALSEDLRPEQVVRLLNTYLGAMADVIFAQRGMIDEFVGDAILAIFGAPLSRDDDARRAVACAISMQLALKDLNRQNEEQGLPRLEMGVAVHTGGVVVGNIGSERRAKYGVVGPPVNATSRIESFAVGGQILVSEAALREAGPDVKVGERLLIEAKGTREPLVAYDLLGIGGEYSLLLPEVEDRPVRLDPPRPVRYRFLEGKVLEGDSLDGAFVELGVRSAVLRTRRRLRPLSTLRFEVPAPGGSPLELYAKVVEVREGSDELYTVRFTSVPASLEARLRDLLAAENARS
jgi:class 3 adenylate cyclase/CheY-like chemotaxis protein